MENRTSLLLNTLKRHRYATLAQQLSATALMITLPSSALAPSSEAVIEFHSSKCPEVSTTMDDLDRGVDVLIEEITESIVEREGDDYEHDESLSFNPYYYDVAETMDIGTTPHDTYTEYSDRIRDSTNFEEAIAIFGEYAQEHYSITVTQLTEEMERNGSLYSPPSQDASPAVAHKLLEALSDIPPSLVENIDYKLGIQMVGEITSFDDDGSHSKNGTFFSNQLTREGTITLSASNHYVYKTFHHELQHAIDTQLGCLNDDPQFDEQNPAWLTEELRQEIYESDDHLSDDTIHGGNYSLKSTGEEKANMASQLFSGEDIPERHISPVMRAKTALLMNQLYELDPDAALWFWWRITDPEGERAEEAYVNTLEGLE